MVSPKKINNVDNSVKYKRLDSVSLKKLQNDLRPFLKDKHLTALLTLIKKYEKNHSSFEIEQLLHSNFNEFQAETHHKIRDFVNRRLRNERKLNSDCTNIYQSDDSNLVSPYSRDSHSSRSDANNVSPTSLNSLKSEISNLWQYPIYQKEICELLWNKGDLDIATNNKVVINFENLKHTTLLALKEFINSRNKVLESYLSDENTRILHDVFLNDSMSDEKISEIYRLIRSRENIPIGETGLFSIDIASLKRETVAELVRFLQPAPKSDKVVLPVKRHASALNQNRVRNATAKTDLEQTKLPPQPQSRYNTEQLRSLSNRIKCCKNPEVFNSILRIVKENETVDPQNNSLNVKKMKDSTLSKLFNLVDSMKI